MQSLLTGVVILFGAALTVAWLMRAARLPTILGFLAAGIVIGPHSLNLIDPESIHFFAELGLVMLLFTVGLELSPAPLLRMGPRLLVTSTIQMTATTLAVAAVLHGVWQTPWGAAVLVGIAVSLSSTAMVLKHLSDRGETDTPAGSLATGILLLQDIAVILLLTLLPLFAATSATPGWSSALIRAGLALLGLICATFLAWVIMPWIVRHVFRFGGRELMTLFAVVMACAGAWLAGEADWSWSLGACIAGLLLGQTDLRHQLHAEITPFRDLSNALFFMSIGMLADLELFVCHPMAFILLIVGTLIVKIILTTGAVLVSRWTLRPALVVGIGLCTISEFGYVLATEAHKTGFLPTASLANLVVVAVGTLLIGSLLLPIIDPLAAYIMRVIRPEAAFKAAESAETPAPSLSSHVIIVGYGINGRNLARVLRETGIPYLVIEMNRGNAHTARQDGGQVIIGDAARLSILSAAGLRNARALVACIADQWATRRIVAQTHTARPDLYILARTRYVSELDVLYRLGAHQVIPEEFETSIEIFAHVLKKFAVPDNVVDQQIAMVRAGRYGMLRGRASDRTMRAEWMTILEAAVTQTFLLFENSPACGRTIRELDLRARTGVTIVAVTRGGQPTTNPSPDFQLESGDVLVLVGTHKQLDEARVVV
jgi:monovalent cation:H+ antiporter-2, CPA2 family